METYRAATLRAAWYDLLQDLIHSGKVVAPRGATTYEFAPVTVTLIAPLMSVIGDPARRLNQAFAAAEFCWIMAGDDGSDLICEFNSRLREFADRFPVGGEPGVPRFFGAYGPMVAAQMPYVLANLEEPDTRQAVISIWRPSPPRTRDVPCTTTLQFLPRFGRLDMVVTMRSNDVWLGMPYDVQTFTRIQSWVAGKSRLRVGVYHHVVGSCHLYDRDLAAAQEVLVHAWEAPTPPPVESFNRETPADALWKAMHKGADHAAGIDFGAGWNQLRDVMVGYLNRKAARGK